MAQLVRVSPPGVCRAQLPGFSDHELLAVYFSHLTVLVLSLAPFIQLIRTVHWSMKTGKIRITRLATVIYFFLVNLKKVLF